MLRRVKNLWFGLKGTYWFLPSAIVLASGVLAFALVYIDEKVSPHTLQKLFWIHARDPQGARDLLTVIAGSMITVAGIVFSINLVALTLASNQFGTRVLRSFVRDIGSQVTLGVFLGTFLYCVLVMRRIAVSDGGEFVPYISIAVGILFSVAGVAVLIYFLHHVVTSIQSENVVSAIESDLRSTIDQVFPDCLAPSAPPDPQPQVAAFMSEFPGQSVPLQYERSGYLQEIDYERLLQAAESHDLVLKIEKQPGDFVTPASVLAHAAPADHLNEHLRRRLGSYFTIGIQRTYAEDIAFGFQQLTYVALRALSPGLNDHATATSALDRISAALICLGGRSIPSPVRTNQRGKPRLAVPVWSMKRLTAEIFTALRFYCLQAPNISRHLHGVLRRTAAQVQHPELRDALLQEVKQLESEMRGKDWIHHDQAA